MRGAFGKPQGVVSRIDIDEFIMSVRVKDQHQANAIEAFRRAKFKFPGRQYVRFEFHFVIDFFFRLLCQRSGDSHDLHAKIMKQCARKVV